MNNNEFKKMQLIEAPIGAIIKSTSESKRLYFLVSATSSNFGITYLLQEIENKLHRVYLSQDALVYVCSQTNK